MPGYFHDTEAVGLYTIALKLATLVMFVIIALNSVLVPRVSEAWWGKDHEWFRRLVRKAAMLMFWSSLLIMPGIWLMADFLLNAIHGLGEHVLDMSGHEKTLTVIVSCGLVVNVMLNYILIPKYGINGAAFATMSSMAFWNLLVEVYVNKRVGVSIVYSMFGGRKASGDHEPGVAGA